MAFKTISQYITLYILLNSIAIFIALKFWWIDSLNANSFDKEHLAIIGAAGICWISTLSFSIMLTRLIYSCDKAEGFIDPFTYAIKNNGSNKKAKKALTLIAFSLFISTLVLFAKMMFLYKDHQLDNNGISQRVIIEKIEYDIKKNPFGYIEYGIPKKIYKTHLPLEKHNIGDTITIVFSKDNPKIIEYSNYKTQ